ncbi:MAG: hypothetical protein E2O74_03790 [Chloroflexi bacterium]|nr:MAG: hypothetical protein E2O74_03790 [Chloroflexota bacterium]
MILKDEDHLQSADNGAEPLSLVAPGLKLPGAFRIPLAGGFLEQKLPQDSQSTVLRPCELLTSILVPVIAFCVLNCVLDISTNWLVDPVLRGAEKSESHN